MELASRGHTERLLVPLDLPSFDEALQGWFGKELTRRAEFKERLVIEIDAETLSDDPASQSRLAALVAQRLPLALHDASGSLTRLDGINARDFRYLRLPAATILGLKRSALSTVLGAWRRPGCALIVDQLTSPTQLAGLRELGVDYVMGEDLVAAGPRPDYEFVYVAH